MVDNAMEMATNNESGETATEGSASETCYYCHNVGVTFRDDNAVARNPALIRFLESVNPEEITRVSEHTTFPVNTSKLAHLMHQLYCECAEDKVINVTWDGIFPFDAPDLDGKMQKFNAQLVTLAEADQ